MKLISYSLFKHPSAQWFERMAYIRGVYWNSRMNALIYPDWRTHLEVDGATYDEFRTLFDWLVDNNQLSLQVNPNSPVLCEGMIWRMKPIFKEGVSHVLCRDADAITTYREACAVQEWLEIGMACLALHDNPGHDGLMGGMVGFNVGPFKSLVVVNSWEEMIAGFDLNLRGSDQHLLNRRILPVLTENIMYRASAGTGVGGRSLPEINEQRYLPGVDKKLWESNLTCRHIGSAGVVDMETIRFFQRFDPYQWKFDVIEREFPELFYWQDRNTWMRQQFPLIEKLRESLKDAESIDIFDRYQLACLQKKILGSGVLHTSIEEMKSALASVK